MRIVALIIFWKPILLAAAFGSLVIAALWFILRESEAVEDDTEVMDCKLVSSNYKNKIV